jgi:exoribonuclease-2
MRQLAASPAPATTRVRGARSHQLPWCSIDNDDSLDLDQLTACETLAGGAVKVAWPWPTSMRWSEGLGDR